MLILSLSPLTLPILSSSLSDRLWPSHWTLLVGSASHKFPGQNLLTSERSSLNRSHCQVAQRQQAHHMVPLCPPPAVQRPRFWVPHSLWLSISEWGWSPSTSGASAWGSGSRAQLYAWQCLLIHLMSISEFLLCARPTTLGVPKRNRCWSLSYWMSLLDEIHGLTCKGHPEPSPWASHFSNWNMKCCSFHMLWD